ncbi:MAG: murein transglycosylase [Rhodospirillales bacterium RIFCSPLOWO2_12_FULL_58_28]|nr:MAG: murein transglycosylase [Rhodospirillales bacterium RIFCSPLOWO2_02_FULL_58_16]OHC79949.1 MAG: murein transglycosylase [Rhodospirillales bacterium RIFCSPLOWO2_12_FULL_58_28]
MRRLPSAAVVIAAVAACAPVAPPPPPGEARLNLTRSTFSMLPGWAEDAHFAALPALVRSCALPATLPDGRRFNVGGSGETVADWKQACAAAGRVPEGDSRAARSYFETWFTPFLAADRENPQGLFTGYYEAELHGSRTRHGRYQTPVYSLPAKATTETRAGIEGGALAGKGLELLWADDPVDVFFLHVQGSGRVVMEDGQTVRLGFAGRNGHAYVSIGHEFVKSGVMPKDQVSMQAIRAWLYAHPQQSAEMMARNPSYIFFREIKGEGPIGAQGVALTPGRSLAVDKQFIPFGLPVWLDTTDPMNPAKPLRRLVVAQDTGGAIKGPVRGDLFWGFGAAAAEKAGEMKQSGRYFLLLPKSAAP